MKASFLPQARGWLLALVIAVPLAASIVLTPTPTDPATVPLSNGPTPTPTPGAPNGECQDAHCAV